MQNPMLESVQRILAAQGVKDFKGRHSIYDRIRAWLRTKAVEADGTIDHGQLNRDIRLLDEAILENELQFSDAGSSHHRMRFFWSSILAASAALVVVSDILSRWFNILHPLLIIGVVGAAAGFAASTLFPVRKRVLRKVGFSFVIVTGMTGGWLLFMGSPPNGAAAENFPAVAELQSGIAQIALRLMRLGQDVQEVSSTGKTIDIRTQRMEDRLNQTKLETSEDPRKELANIGLAWTQVHFGMALANKDTRATRLFLAGGQTVPRQQFFRFIEHEFDPQIAELLVAYKQRVDREACIERPPQAMDVPLQIKDQLEFLKLVVLPDAHKKAFYFSICDAKSIREQYAKMASEIEAEVKIYDARTKARLKERDECIAELRPKYLPVKRGLSEWDFRQLARSAYFEAKKRTENALSEAARNLHAQMGIRDVYDTLDRLQGEAPDLIVGHLIEEGCVSAYYRPDPPKVDRLQEIRNVLALTPAG